MYLIIGIDPKGEKWYQYNDHSLSFLEIQEETYQYIPNRNRTDIWDIYHNPNQCEFYSPDLWLFSVQ